MPCSTLSLRGPSIEDPLSPNGHKQKERSKPSLSRSLVRLSTSLLQPSFVNVLVAGMRQEAIKARTCCSTSWTHANAKSLPARGEWWNKVCALELAKPRKRLCGILHSIACEPQPALRRVTMTQTGPIDKEDGLVHRVQAGTCCSRCTEMQAISLGTRVWSG